MKYMKILIAVLLSAAVFAGCVTQPGHQQTPPSTQDTTVSTTVPTTQPTTKPTTAPTTEPTTEPTTAPTTVPTEPPIVKETTATIGATGDILLHDLVIRSGYDKQTGTYNYDDIFTFFQEYASKVDYAVANLEVTLCGDDNGYSYKGYPCFNSPDAIVDALKNAGFDMLLTANNHAYDTGNVGFHRTQQVIADKGLSHIGTRPSEEDKPYTVVDVNGIRVGMINYTYCTGLSAEGKVALNGIGLSLDNSKLVNVFHYQQLDTFYAQLQSQVDAMRDEGAEALVIYIHWGDEYQIKHNAKQEKIAQQLCNMGFDVIVGNHAHVPQDTQLLTSQVDENHKTACLYSTGNAISNIYGNNTFPVQTEDGMLFTFTFAKYSDGTVVVESVDILPTWVYRYYNDDGVCKFKIFTMDDSVKDWQEQMDLSDSQLKSCQASYDRTMDIVGEGLADINDWCQANQAAVENQLGVLPE